MAERFPVTAWKPVLMVRTEHLEWQVIHWRKKSRVSLFKIVSGERQARQVTYSLMYRLKTFSICFCWNFPFMTSWLLPSMAPVVPNSANKNANKCLGCRWSLKSKTFHEDAVWQHFRIINYSNQSKIFYNLIQLKLKSILFGKCLKA